MNKIYRTVYNETTGTWVAVCETAKTHTKSSGKSSVVKAMAVAGLTAVAGVSFAAPVVEGVNTDCEFTQDGIVCIGNNTSAFGTNVTVVGAGAKKTTGTQASGGGETIIGAEAEAVGNGSVAIGGKGGLPFNRDPSTGTVTYGKGTVAVGRNARAMATVLERDSDGRIDFTKIKNSNGGSVLDGTDALTKSIVVDGEHGVTKASDIHTGQNIAVGDNSQAFSHQSIAVGANTMALGVSSIAIGGDDVGDGTGKGFDGNDKVIGEHDAGFAQSLNTVKAIEKGLETIGDNFKSQAEGTTTLQHSDYVPEAVTNILGAAPYKDTTMASGDIAMAIGQKAQATGNLSNAVGMNAVSSGESSLAVGTVSRAIGQYSNAVGTGATAKGEGANALGTGATAVGKYANAIGTSQAEGIYASAMGYLNLALGNDAVAVGTQNISGISEGGTYETVAMGVENKATGSQSIAIGTKNHSDGIKSLAYGTNNLTTGTESITFGSGNRVESTNSGVFGSDSQVTNGSDGSYAIGKNNGIAVDNTFILGNNVGQKNIYNPNNGEVAGTTGDDAVIANSVYLGSGSTTQSTGERAALGTVNNAKVGGITYGFSGGTTPNGIISVGSASNARRIQNVAAGEISETSTDAINGSQLHAVLPEYFKDTPNGAEQAEDGDTVTAIKIGDKTYNFGNAKVDLEITNGKVDEVTGNDPVTNQPNDQKTVTAADVVNVVNNTYWVASDGTTNATGAENTTQVKASNKVTIKGENGVKVGLDADSKIFTVESDIQFLKDDGKGGTTNASDGDIATAIKLGDNTYNLGGGADGNDNTVTDLTVNGGEEANKTTGNLKLTDKGTDDNHKYDVSLNDTVTLGSDQEDGGLTVVNKAGDSKTEINPNNINFTNADGGSITNVAGHLADQTSADKTINSGNVPANFDDKAKHEAATLGDVLNAGWNLKVGNTEADFVQHGDTVEFGNSDTITANYDNGVIKFNANTTGLTVTNGVVQAHTNSNSLVTAGDVETAINNAGWFVNSGKTTGQNSGASRKLVSAGNEVKFIAGDGIEIVQNGKEFTFNTKIVDTNGNQLKVNDNGEYVVGIVNPNGDPVTINNDGEFVVDGGSGAGGNPFTITADDGNGNEDTTTINGIAKTEGSGITFKGDENVSVTKQPTAGGDGTDVQFGLNDVVNVGGTDDGTNNGTPNTGSVTIDGNNGDITFNDATPVTIGTDDNGNLKVGDQQGNPVGITNVAGHLADQTSADTEMLAGNAPANFDDAKNDAATVGDVLNAGWNLKVGGTEADFVQHGDTIDFANGKGTTAQYDSATGAISFDIAKNTNSPVNSNVSVTDTEAGKVINGVADQYWDSEQVQDAINNAGWKVGVGETAADEDKLINAGNRVGFVSGNGVTVKQVGNNFHFDTTPGYTEGLEAGENIAITDHYLTDQDGNQLYIDAQGNSTTEATDADGNANRVQKTTVISATQPDLTPINNRIDQVQNQVQQVENNAYAGVAQAMATAGLPQAYLPGKSMVAVAGGYYKGESGYALGVSSISDSGNWVFKATASGNSRNNFGGTIGAGYQW